MKSFDGFFFKKNLKSYINLSPISDQISPAFEGQTTSGEVKKIFWKWQFFWQMRWHRNFLVLYSSTAGMYYLNFVRKKWYIFITSRRTIGDFKIVRNIVSELRYCPDLKMIWWNLKCLHIYLYDMIIEDMCLSVKIQVLFYQGTWSRSSQTWMGQASKWKISILHSKNLEIFLFYCSKLLENTLRRTGHMKHFISGFKSWKNTAIN